MQNKVTRMENVKDVEHMSMKRTNIHCIGILDGERMEGNRKCLMR